MTHPDGVNHELPFWHPEVIDASEILPATPDQLVALRNILTEAADTLTRLIQEGKIGVLKDDYIREDSTVRVSTGREAGQAHPGRLFVSYSQRPASLNSAHTIYRLNDNNGVLGLVKEMGTLLGNTPIVRIDQTDETEISRAALLGALSESANMIRNEADMRELVPGLPAVNQDECQAVLDDVSASWEIRKVELGVA